MQPGPCERERRIERDGALQMRDAEWEGLRSPIEVERHAAQILVVGGDIVRHARHAPHVAHTELDLQSIRNRLRDLVLNQEDVIETAFVGLGPQLIARACVAQLRGDAHLIARLAHAALQNMSDAKRIADRAQILVAILEME